MIERDDYYKVAGVAIKHPTTFKVERYKITNAARLANGDMVADVLNHKRKFFFTYKAISSTELNKILDAVWNNDDYFFEFEYKEQTSAGLQTQKAIVYPSAIPTELAKADGTWVWKNVSFSLIER